MHDLPTVAAFMDKRPLQLSPDTGIHDAVAFLLENRVTGVPIVDAEGTIHGLLNERDCLRLLAEGQGGDVAAGTVREYMSADPRSVESGMDVYYVAGKFLRDENAAVRRFLVVDDGKLEGVITRYDILRAIAQRAAETGE